MVAIQTEIKKEILTETGQFRRSRDLILVANDNGGESDRNNGKNGNGKSNRNWAIQAIERLMVANDNGGESDRNNGKNGNGKSNRNWAIQAIERLMVANQTEIKKIENLTDTGK